MYYWIQFLGKWLVCSWLHYRVWVFNNKGQRVRVSGRCYPRCDLREGEPGADYWHCHSCHPCGEELDKFLKRKN